MELVVDYTVTNVTKTGSAENKNQAEHISGAFSQAQDLEGQHELVLNGNLPFSFSVTDPAALGKIERGAVLRFAVSVPA